MKIKTSLRFRQIAGLSLLGLAMGMLTLEVISAGVEPFIWFFIFLFSAWRIGRISQKGAFLHGLLTGIANSIWITMTQYLWYDTYLENHPAFSELFHDKTFEQIRGFIPALGLFFGLVSGLVLGGFSYVAALIFSRRNPGVSI
jgi:hypothetical protein